MAVEADPSSPQPFKQFIEQANGLSDHDFMGVLTSLAAVFLDRKCAVMLKLGVRQDGRPICLLLGRDGGAENLQAGYAVFKEEYAKSRGEL